MNKQFTLAFFGILAGGFAALAYQTAKKVKPGKVLILGDSIWASGKHIDHLRSLSQFTIDNKSIVGQSTPTHLRKAQNYIPNGNYKTVIISGGVNDLGSSSKEAILDRLQTMVRLAKNHGAKVVLTTLVGFKGHPSHTTNRDQKAQWINNEIKKIQGVILIDMRSILGDPLLRRYDAGDHLHLNQAGQRALIPRLVQVGFKE